MNGKLVNGRPIYLNRAQKKNKRQVEVYRKYEAEKMKHYNRLVVQFLNVSRVSVSSHFYPGSKG